MLVSAFNPVSRLLPRVEPELKAKTVAFIPTASKGSLYSPIMGLAKHALRRMDVRIYSLDIARASYGLIHAVIAASDIIYVGGEAIPFSCYRKCAGLGPSRSSPRL